jgi:hypothetical protein
LAEAQVRGYDAPEDDVGSPPLISPLDEKKETATASTAFLSRIVGQAKRTVKQIFEKPSLYALQFDRLAVLIAVSEVC